MLVIAVNKDQEFLIGDSVVRVLYIRGNRIGIGIDGPETVLRPPVLGERIDSALERMTPEENAKCQRMNTQELVEYLSSTGAFERRVG